MCVVRQGGASKEGIAVVCTILKARREEAQRELAPYVSGFRIATDKDVRALAMKDSINCLTAPTLNKTAVSRVVEI